MVPPRRFLVGCSFNLHATRRTPHGASRLVHALSGWLVKTRRAPPRHYRDARIYGLEATPRMTMGSPRHPTPSDPTRPDPTRPDPTRSDPPHVCPRLAQGRTAPESPLEGSDERLARFRDVLSEKLETGVVSMLVRGAVAEV